ncbi:MAG: hypothetical protein C0617_06510 [Desulfuromonas sp.]|uniref:YqgE/AlgH family protein n=1 Tax=Desulfuromonas sp. TaxID=892 RepID=UPI000CB194E6|nr:YqgE/AlgH family protein [Desulfuromonas sp.]PLX84857.1 MAG: hypothetical protein C0617_06510 [Desulfuromonas sp.]
MHPFAAIARRSLVLLTAAFVMASALLAIELAGPDALHAQSALAPRVGRLLLATEGMGDPRFRQTVILLVRHDKGGTMGLVLNRPMVDIPYRLPSLLADKLDLLYHGGPVNAFTPTALLQSDTPPPQATRVTGNVYLVGLGPVADHLAEDPRPDERLRVYMGSAGWAPGQLAGEIARGAWQVVPGSRQDVFDPDPNGLWERLIETGKIITI